MAGGKEPVFDPIEDLKILAFIFTVLWLFWYANGGPAKYEASQQKPFLYAPATRSSQGIWQDPDIGAQYGSIPKIQIKAQMSKVEPFTKYSSFDKPILFLSKGPANQSGWSYLKLDFSASNKAPLGLAGLLVRDIFGKSVAVGGASDLPYQGMINEERDISILPGSTVFLIDGASPIGASFRVNKCIGLLAEFQEFYPPLPLAPVSPSLDWGITGTSSSIRSATYNGCVNAHKDDLDFYSNNWRIYLKTKVWSQTGDFVRLVDPQGNTLASLFY